MEVEFAVVELAALVALAALGGESVWEVLSGVRLYDVNGEEGEKYDEGVPVPGVLFPLPLAVNEWSSRGLAESQSWGPHAD